MIKTAETTFIVVRHGETEWNLARKQQGHLDSPLTKTGVAQANLLAKSLHEHDIEVLYSSDLGRALHTAEIIGSELQIEINVDNRLRERNFGKSQGLTMEDFRHRWPEEAAQVDSGDPDYVPPGGESLRQFSNRCVAACVDLADRYPDKRVLLVAHGGVLRSIFCHIVGIEPTESRRFSIFNAAINSFSISGESWRLLTWGATCHLQGINTLDEL